MELDFNVYCPILSVCLLYFAFLTLVSLYNYLGYEAIEYQTCLGHRCAPFYLPNTRRCHPGGQSRRSGCAGLPPPFHPLWPFPAIHTFPWGSPRLCPSSRAPLRAAGRAELFLSLVKGIRDEKWLRECFSNNLVREICLLLFLGLLHFTWERAAVAIIRFKYWISLKIPHLFGKGDLRVSPAWGGSDYFRLSFFTGFFRRVPCIGACCFVPFIYPSDSEVPSSVSLDGALSCSSFRKRRFFLKNHL